MLDGMGDSHSRPMSQVAAVLSGRLKLGFEEAVTGPRRLSGDLDARRDPRAPPSATEEMVQPARISLTNWAVCPIWSLKRWYIPIITASAGLMPLNVAAIRSFTCCGESTVRRPRRLSGALDARRDPRPPPSATEEMVQPASISLTNWAVCPIWSLKRWYIPIITASAGLMP